MKDVVIQNRPGQKKTVFKIIGTMAVLLLIAIACISRFGSNEKKIQRQLDLGAKYLEEMDYEQALVAFNAVIDIEPKNVDAYLGIVEVYIRTNEFEAALETAKKGYEITGDERLQEKIDMIESGNIFASNGWTMKMSGYDGEGNLVFWHEYTYNLKGQRASVAKYNPQGVQEQYLELTYDAEGRNLISYVFSSREGNLDKIERTYNGNNYRETWYAGISNQVSCYRDAEADSDGKVLKEISYQKDGNVMQTTVYEYDGDGKQIKRMLYNADSELGAYYFYTYDENGKPLQEQYYGKDNNLRSYREYVYDDEGNYIGARDYSADGTLEYEHIYQ